MSKQPLLVGTAIAVVVSGVVATRLAPGAVEAQAVQAPKFAVDPYWPNPLPPHSIIGSVNGVAVDARDHVFVVNNPTAFTARTETWPNGVPPPGYCCAPTSPVLEFDAAGTLVKQWGGAGQGYDWPSMPSGIAVDDKGNVWIGSGGTTDGQILKFSSDGKFLMQAGKAGEAAPAAAAPTGGYAPGTLGTNPPDAARGRAADAGAAPQRGGGGGGGRGRGASPLAPLTQPPGHSTSQDTFGAPARFAFDTAASEVYVADGYRNRRVAVLDMTTGKIKRMWGAYGKPPDDGDRSAYQPGGAAPQQFSSVTCVVLAKDGMVYVCDRGNDRIQVFQKNGTFVKEKSVAPKTLGEGSVWDVALSRDGQQKYLYVADGSNSRVRVLDRQSLDELTAFGDGGRYPSQFTGLQGLATDSKGNLYTSETYEGKRVQRFLFKGVTTITAHDQGAVRSGSER
jgi:DNA-binding beta-propeller fold protein YncE